MDRMDLVRVPLPQAGGWQDNVLLVQTVHLGYPTVASLDSAMGGDCLLMKLSLKFQTRTKPIHFHNNLRDLSTTILQRTIQSYLEEAKTAKIVEEKEHNQVGELVEIREVVVEIPQLVGEVRVKSSKVEVLKISPEVLLEEIQLEGKALHLREAMEVLEKEEAAEMETPETKDHVLVEV